MQSLLKIHASSCPPANHVASSAHSEHRGGMGIEAHSAGGRNHGQRWERKAYSMYCVFVESLECISWNHYEGILACFIIFFNKWIRVISYLPKFRIASEIHRYFSKEIIKKDIPLSLQSYLQDKYCDRCGSVHLGAESGADPEAVSTDAAGDTSRGPSPASPHTPSIAGGWWRQQGTRTVSLPLSGEWLPWENGLSFKDGNGHAKTPLTKKRLSWNTLGYDHSVKSTQ